MKGARMLTDYERKIIAEMEAALAADRRRPSAIALSTLRPVLALLMMTAAAVMAAGLVVAALAVTVAL
jgi:hypothetical protein